MTKTMQRTALAALMALAMIGAATAQTTASQTLDIRELGRQLAEEKGEAVISIRIVATLTASYGGQGQENEFTSEIMGVVARPDGTTLAPLSSIDPAQMIRNYMGGQMGDEMSIDSRIKDLTLLVGEDREIAATIVLRDSDLDLAVIQPQAPVETPIAAIDMTNHGKAQLLAPVVSLARLGRIGDRAIAAMTGEVQSIFEKPRLFYVPSSELATGGTGAPVFTREGKVLGLLLSRVQRNAGDNAFNTMMGASPSALGVILPAEDIVELLAQAPAAAGEE